MKDKTSKTFVMADIHGSYKALVQCLERSGFDYANDVLIQLGDVVDGHNEVYECVEELLKIKNLISIEGNHDVWFNEFIKTDYHPVLWQYGGKNTILSYLKYKEGPKVCISKGGGVKTSLCSSDIPASHRQFFQNQRLYHITEDNKCFVHAGFDRYIDFKEQREQNYYWDRNLWSEALAQKENSITSKDFEMVSEFKEIYIGHTATTNWGTDLPMTAYNIINLDTGAGHSGKLTIMDIDTKEIWQSDPVKELYVDLITQWRDDNRNDYAPLPGS
ncbi:metallophosphoesterase [Sphingobacterium sp.]|uniref:metallophosphoesterase n=1 Tax=Sphingobacterium sp. TaxID=341027 RepID=UPI002582C4BD|nr:metallophosphoesterase [Sphingobacterium sp.]WET69090.1 MAG: metallophosphoesterase [Sphingobacterium sp.]